MPSVKTAGTELFIIDPADDSLLKIDCPTVISGLSGSRSQIDDSCLEDIADSFQGGRITPGTATLGINTDPQNASHLRLHQLYKEGTKFKFAIGWGDFTPPPPAAGPVPVVDSNGNFNPAAGRSWIIGEAYVSDFPFDFNANDVVRSSLTLQQSGLVDLFPRTA